MIYRNMDQDGNYMTQIVQSLSFEVAALPQDNVLQFSNTPSSTPMNVKIKVKNKPDPRNVQHAVISIPKLSLPRKIGQDKRVRLVNSDQTIMSFNMFMESKSDQKISQKAGKSFFGLFKSGGCLDPSAEEDDYSYAPSSSTVKSEEQTKLTQPTMALKQKMDNEKEKNGKESSNTKSVYLGQCKPGGCLDPPFGEERHPYQPTERNISKSPQPALVVTVNKTPPKEDAKANVIQATKPYKLPINTNKTVTHERDQEKKLIEPFYILKQDTSDTDIYKSEPPRTELGTKYSHSIITYPPAATASEMEMYNTMRENTLKSVTDIDVKTRISFSDSTDIYFAPKKQSLDNEKGNSAENTDLPEQILLNNNAENNLVCGNNHHNNSKLSKKGTKESSHNTSMNKSIQNNKNSSEKKLHNVELNELSDKLRTPNIAPDTHVPQVIRGISKTTVNVTNQMSSRHNSIIFNNATRNVTDINKRPSTTQQGTLEMEKKILDMSLSNKKSLTADTGKPVKHRRESGRLSITSPNRKLSQQNRLSKIEIIKDRELLPKTNIHTAAGVAAIASAGVAATGPILVQKKTKSSISTIENYEDWFENKNSKPQSMLSEKKDIDPISQNSILSRDTNPFEFKEPINFDFQLDLYKIESNKMQINQEAPIDNSVINIEKKTKTDVSDTKEKKLILMTNDVNEPRISRENSENQSAYVRDDLVKSPPRELHNKLSLPQEAVNDLKSRQTNQLKVEEKIENNLSNINSLDHTVPHPFPEESSLIRKPLVSTHIEKNAVENQPVESISTDSLPNLPKQVLFNRTSVEDLKISNDEKLEKHPKISNEQIHQNTNNPVKMDLHKPSLKMESKEDIVKEIMKSDCIREMNNLNTQTDGTDVDRIVLIGTDKITPQNYKLDETAIQEANTMIPQDKLMSFTQNDVKEISSFSKLFANDSDSVAQSNKITPTHSITEFNGTEKQDNIYTADFSNKEPINLWRNQGLNDIVIKSQDKIDQKKDIDKDLQNQKEQSFDESFLSIINEVIIQNKSLPLESTEHTDVVKEDGKHSPSLTNIEIIGKNMIINESHGNLEENNILPIQNYAEQKPSALEQVFPQEYSDTTATIEFNHSDSRDSEMNQQDRELKAHYEVSLQSTVTDNDSKPTEENGLSFEFEIESEKSVVMHKEHKKNSYIQEPKTFLGDFPSDGRLVAETMGFEKDEDGTMLLENKFAENYTGYLPDITLTTTKFPPPLIKLEIEEKVMLDIALQTFLNKNNDRVVKSRDTETSYNGNAEDKIFTVRRFIGSTDSALKISVSSEHELSIQLNKKDRNASDGNLSNWKKSKGDNFISGLPKSLDHTNVAHNSQVQEIISKSNAKFLDETLNLIYEQLMPLQNTIRSLKQEIEQLAEEQEYFRERLLRLRKRKSMRFKYSRTCACWKN